MNEDLAGGPSMGAAAGAPPPAPTAPPSEPQQASPEEQELYTRFVSKAFSLIYDKEFFPQVTAMLEGEGDPAEGLARTTAMVVVRVVSAAREGGQDMPGDVLFHAAKEVFEDLADLSGRARIKDYGADQDALEGAFFRAMDALRIELAGSGFIDQAAAEADLAELQRMDQAGELEGLFRGLAERDDAGRSPPPSDEPEPRRGGGLMPEGSL